MPHLVRRTALSTLLFCGLLLPTATSEAGPAKGVVRAHMSLGSAHVHAAKAAIPRARAAQECANADVMPSASNEAAVRAAILCLHNRIRAGRGLPALRENARLRRAAVGHSNDMVSRGFFDHTAPGGSTMVDRIMASRYVTPDVGWSLGENLAWGTGNLATPREIMKAWMDSPGHRANIVKRSYREVGIGVVTGTPSDGADGATYTADFGVIRR
jgi:uncharacterized protein YkwD